MRRALTMFVILAGAVSLTGIGTPGDDRVRVDAMFDSAKGLVPGQAVKVAGSSIGEIKHVGLVREPNGGYEARLGLAIDRQFAPFHADATCRILPQGLLSENYVECDPGSPSKPALPAGVDGAPTVAVEHTSVPATLQDLLNTFSMPTSDRLALLLSQLGLGTAGHGADINAILRRANPALVQAERVLRIAADQRALLRNSVTETDRILAGLSRDDSGVRRLVTGAADLAETTASRRADLAEGIRRMPATLNAIETTLPSLERLTTDGTPLLRSLRTAAPSLTGFTQRFPVFAPPATRALSALGDAATVGRHAVKAARKPATHLRQLATASVPTLRSADALAVDARDNGAFEDLLRLNYGMSSGTGTYDAQGHVLLIGIDAYPRCIVAAMVPGTQVEPGCSHAYSSPGGGRAPLTQLPPAGTGGTRVNANAVSDLLDYVLK